MRNLAGLALLLMLQAGCGTSTGDAGETHGSDTSLTETRADLGPADTAIPDPDAVDTRAPHDATDMDVPVPDDHGEDLFDDAAPDAGQDQGEDTLLSVDPVEEFLTVLNSGDSVALETLLQAYSGPVCYLNRCLVISAVPFEGDVAIRGCFNQWEEGDLMSAVAGKTSYYYYIVEPVSFDKFCEYRLYYGGDWHDDLSNPYMRFSDVSINNAIYLDGISRLARIRSVYAAALDNYRDVYVYVPAEAFPDKGKKFPVMYMQDGFNVFKNPMAPFGSWEVDVALDAMIANGELAPLVVVGIDTQDRLNEYLYCSMDIDLGDEVFHVDPKLDQYLTFVVEDLKPVVDALFPTLTGREFTGIGGSSLGGISSLYMGWKRPDVFGKVASFSGSYSIGEEYAEGEGGISFLQVLEANPPTSAHAGLKVYLDSGDQGDSEVPYASDSRVHTDWVRNALIRYGWSNRPEWTENGDVFTAPTDYAVTTDPAEVPTLYWSKSLPNSYATWEAYLRPDLDLLHLVGAGHWHNEQAWRERFPAAVRFLFGG